MSESKYLIQGSTLTAIANALRIQGGCFDNLKPSQMTSYIQNKLMSYGVFDAIISDPTISSATETTINSSLLLNTLNSRAYMIKDTTLTSIANALRDKGAFSDAMTAAQMPSYIQNKIVSQGLINNFYNKTLESIYNSTATTIGTQAFQSCMSLHTVEFTECTTVGSSAFKDCTILSNLSMSKVTTVNTDAFSNCKSIVNMTMGIETILSTDAIGKTLIDNASLKTLILPNCITISDSVCRKCYSLSFLCAPKLKNVYQNAFHSCSSLTEINLPVLGSGNTWGVGTNTFASCISLINVSLPEIVSMNAGAFSNCTALKKFYAPKLAGHANTTVFTNVKSFEEVTVGYTIIPSLWSGQENLVYFSDSNATEIGSAAFQGCDALKLENCTFGTKTNCTLTNIRSSAFMSCPGITSLSTTHFPQTTPQIVVGISAFASCTNLSEINCDSFVSVMQQAFAGCTSLTKATFLNASHLGRSVFQGCTNLSYLSAPNVTSLYTDSSWFPIAGCDNITFVNLDKLAIIPAALFRTRTALQSVIINNATAIYSSAFSGCTSLSDVRINNVIALASDNIFIGCTALNENGIQAANLQYINSASQGAFRNTGFVSIHPSTFPKLLSIGYNAFQSCASLTSAHLSTTTTYLGRSAFGQCTALTYLSAPGVNSIYTASNWVPTSGCTNLEFANLNGLATIPYALFTGLTKLQSVYVNGATTLAQSAFRGCTSLKTIYMNSMVTIGTQSVFENCTALNETGIYASNLASLNHDDFKNTGFTKLTSATFPKLNYMGHRNFQNCANLSSVDLPLVTYLGQYAFGNCSLLTYVSLPAVTGFYNDSGQNALVSCPNITFANFDGVPNVSYYLFNDRSKLTSVRVNSASRIDQSAFQNCAALTSIAMDKVTDIRSYAFNGCTSLSNIYAPALIQIGYNYAFKNTGFRQLTSAMFPALTSVHHWMFQNCLSLSSVNLPEVIYLGASAFGECTALTYLSVPAVTSVYTANGYVPTSGCANLTFANFAALTTVPRYLFTNLQKLSSVILTNAANIQAYAFQSCNALTTITLPKATLIYSSAFINNTGIENIQIGNPISSALALTISAQAFSGCTNLSIISILHTSLATLQNSNAFTGTGITSTTGKIIVPESLYATYQTQAQWSYFKDIMSTVTF